MATTNASQRAKVLEEILLRLPENGKTLSRIYAASLELACEQIGGDAGSIFLVEEGRDRLRTAAVRGEKGKALRRLAITKDSGIVGWTIRKGRTAVVSKVDEDPRYDRKVAEKIGYATKNLVSIPIKSGKTAIGALEVLNWRGKTPSKAKVERLGEIARILGKVIEQSKG